jgi:uncharacterized membrane protein (Fun14 family)
MLALLLLLVLNHSPQYSLIGSVKNVFSHAERVYGAQSRAWGSEVCEWLFRIGVLAMAVWILAIGNGRLDMGYGRLAIGNGAMGYAKVLALVLGVYIVQRLVLRGVGYVFVSRKQLSAAMEQYNAICSAACVCLYPIVLVVMNVPAAHLAQILCGAVLVAFVGMIVWKSIRLFYTNILSLLYILLYIIFLEIMPIMVIFSVAKLIISL